MSGRYLRALPECDIFSSQLRKRKVLKIILYRLARDDMVGYGNLIQIIGLFRIDSDAKNEKGKGRRLRDR